MTAVFVRTDAEMIDALKRDLRAARRKLPPLLADPPGWLKTARVRHLLAALPGWDDERTGDAMARAGVARVTRIGGLGVRQRAALTMIIDPPPPLADERPAVNGARALWAGRLARGEYVKNELLRREIERAIDRGGVTWVTLGDEVGVDPCSLSRSFGFGRRGVRLVQHDLAAKVCRLVGADPVDVGL